MAIRIITDSAADLEIGELAERNIHRISQEVRFGDEVFTDGVNMDKDSFFRRLMDSKEAATTSQPSPDAFLAEFEAARDAGEPAVVVLISSALSGTYQSACIAKELCGYEDIYLVDSRSATAGERLLIDEACRMRDLGCSALEIASELNRIRDKLRIFAVVDTLEYLCRGGRLSKTEAQIGSIAHVKPILALGSDGVIRSRDKAMGLSRARVKLTKLLEQTPFDSRYPVYPLYSYSTDNCMKLCEEFRKEYPDTVLAEPVGIGPTIGAHVGPGVLGLVYMER